MIIIDYYLLLHVWFKILIMDHQWLYWFHYLTYYFGKLLKLYFIVCIRVGTSNTIRVNNREITKNKITFYQY